MIMLIFQMPCVKFPFVGSRIVSLIIIIIIIIIKLFPDLVAVNPKCFSYLNSNFRGLEDKFIFGLN